MSVADTVKSIIVNHLGVRPEKVDDAAKLHDDLGADSLDIIDLSIAIDAELDVPVQDSALDEIETVGELISHVEDLLKEKMNG